MIMGGNTPIGGQGFVRTWGRPMPGWSTSGASSVEPVETAT